MKKLFLFLAIFAFAFTSCKKTKDKSCTLSETTLLGNYKVASIKYKASATAPEQDFTDQLQACEKDDVTTFNANHTYNYTDAGTACTTNGDYNGDWSLSGNVLSVDGDPGTIDNFSCSGFTVALADYNTPGDKFSVNYTKQ